MFAIVRDYDGSVDKEDVLAGRYLLRNGPDGLDRADCREGSQSNQRLDEHACLLAINLIFARQARRKKNHSTGMNAGSSGHSISATTSIISCCSTRGHLGPTVNHQ
jgi:hypothetical protein